MNKLRAVLITLALLIGGGAGIGLMASPAFAESDFFFDFAAGGFTNCGLETHGAGNNVTWVCSTGTSDDRTQFYATSASNGDYKFHVMGSSHCLQPYTSTGSYVTVQDCQAGNGLQEWAAHNTGTGCEWTVHDVPSEYLAGGPGTGIDMRVLTNTSGWYIRFIPCPPPLS